MNIYLLIGAGFVALILFRRDLHTVRFLCHKFRCSFTYRPPFWHFVPFFVADHILLWNNFKWNIQQNTQKLDPRAAANWTTQPKRSIWNAFITFSVHLVLLHLFDVIYFVQVWSYFYFDIPVFQNKFVGNVPSFHFYQKKHIWLPNNCDLRWNNSMYKSLRRNSYLCSNGQSS